MRRAARRSARAPAPRAICVSSPTAWTLVVTSSAPDGGPDRRRGSSGGGGGGAGRAFGAAAAFFVADFERAVAGPAFARVLAALALERAGFAGAAVAAAPLASAAPERRPRRVGLVAGSEPRTEGCAFALLALFLGFAVFSGTKSVGSFAITQYSHPGRTGAVRRCGTYSA
jgi:hypothetical protein